MTDLFSGLSFQEDHLPDLQLQVSSCGLNSFPHLFLPSLYNHPVVLTVAPRCHQPHREEHLHSHLGGESPTGNPVLFYGPLVCCKFPFLQTLLAGLPFPLLFTIPKCLFLTGLVSKITVIFPRPYAALQVDGSISYCLIFRSFCTKVSAGQIPIVVLLQRHFSLHPALRAPSVTQWE